MMKLKIVNQKKGVDILKKLIENENNEKEKKILETALFHQIEHFNLIKKFKRFPKRNLILNRKSSNEELNYIQNSNKYLPY